MNDVIRWCYRGILKRGAELVWAGHELKSYYPNGDGVDSLGVVSSGPFELSDVGIWLAKYKVDDE